MSDITVPEYTPQTLEEAFSARVLRKARLLLRAPHLRPTSEDGMRWSVGSVSSLKRYEVITPERDAEHPLDPIPDLVTCECHNGFRRPRPQCYHVAAVLIMKGWEVSGD